jgi:hypothetical protein
LNPDSCHPSRLTNVKFVILMLFNEGNRESAVGIATGSRLDGRGVGVCIPARGNIFLISTGYGAHPASYSMGTGDYSPRVKCPGREDQHSPPSSAEVKNGGAIPPLPDTSSWRGA